ncbi:hypothetical protein [Herbaspirillum rubrisubalbicans]|uniref:Uncharacterized protein n=1 Tax=Herbaspirillum rubrisubalbicans TaxID=80842 RepID=A0AAD0U4G0_9BURK|nr:hypothetical protein [Herbaspirillum rubrisubalbicans]AYR23038.1 hypothetical protein RC54_04030 [Herbaspirillum rubrisubalbicans]
MKIQLVDDKGLIHRRWSVRLAKVGAAVMAGWAALTSAGLGSTLPIWVAQVVAGVILVCICGAAYLKQPEPAEKGQGDEAPPAA